MLVRRFFDIEGEGLFIRVRVTDGQTHRRHAGPSAAGWPRSRQRWGPGRPGGGVSWAGHKPGSTAANLHLQRPCSSVKGAGAVCSICSRTRRMRQRSLAGGRGTSRRSPHSGDPGVGSAGTADDEVSDVPPRGAIAHRMRTHLDGLGVGQPGVARAAQQMVTERGRDPARLHDRVTDHRRDHLRSHPAGPRSGPAPAQRPRVAAVWPPPPARTPPPSSPGVPRRSWPP